MSCRNWRKSNLTLAQIYERCTDDCGCMLWNGAHNHTGQPKIRNESARRVVWEMKYGPIPDGMLVSVDCNHVNCLKHLILSTRAEVLRRANASADVRARKSLGNARSARKRLGKINMDIAREIRASAETGKNIAARLNVSPSLVSLVRRGKSWREATASPFAGLSR